QQPSFKLELHANTGVRIEHFFDRTLIAESEFSGAIDIRVATTANQFLDAIVVSNDRSGSKCAFCGSLRHVLLLHPCNTMQHRCVAQHADMPTRMRHRASPVRSV